ncbi:hypothetical protein DQ04_00101130 [Trypanosoma grayi]|uniref:hypothetical protein n=1 Tax=Trypanosoma grayi TaxID=71804 RepID=UPI0004F42F49|nr:hypothetical protein DQ04_00101130 [Trypanosoma grayi]KEG15346.1 hypothetical protein DQ04_00101130 [Trypanosoma grayi]
MALLRVLSTLDDELEDRPCFFPAIAHRPSTEAGKRASSASDTLAVDQHSLRYIYTHSCKEHQVRPNKHILQQLPPVVGRDWPRKVKALDFSLTYVGRDGCSALVPVVAFCSAMTHLVMPSIGLTEEAARPLLAALQVHPTVTWIDLSGNDLNDDVGRCILNMVLANSRIRFVCLNETGISPPLIRKIQHYLKPRDRSLLERKSSSSSTLDWERLSFSVQSSLSGATSGHDGTRAHRLPASVAAGLAELRHRLYRNRHRLQYVYDCFILPKGNAEGSDDRDDEALVDVMRVNGEWDTVSISAMYTGHCSWRAFFRGLRVLGIHAVSRSLTESVVFATICGICNLETISFGKLLSFLRPHVGFTLSPPRTKVGSGSISAFCSSAACSPSRFSSECGVSPTQCRQAEATSGIPNADASLCSHSSAKSIGEGRSRTSIDRSVLTPLFTDSLPLMLKPQSSVLMWSKSGRSLSGCSLTSNAAGDSGIMSSLVVTKTLEELFKLELLLPSRKLQYAVDRLYDSRRTLRESFQPVDELGEARTKRMARLDEVVGRAVSVVGEAFRDSVTALLGRWLGHTGVDALVNVEELLDSMYIPESTESPAAPPLPLSTERRMWRGVEVETLQNALSAW